VGMQTVWLHAGRFVVDSQAYVKRTAANAEGPLRVPCRVSIVEVSRA
jgi:hypothetical protein